MLKTMPIEDAGKPADAIEQTVNIPDEAANPGPKDPDMLERETKMDEILEKINDPNFSVSEVSRLIAVEMATVSRQMARIDYDPAMQWKFKAYNEQVKALQVLGKQLGDADILSRKDIINFDGPKFQFVLSQIVDLVKSAIHEAGTEPTQGTSIMKHFRDLISANEQRIRHETERIDSGKK